MATKGYLEMLWFVLKNWQQIVKKDNFGKIDDVIIYTSDFVS